MMRRHALALLAILMLWSAAPAQAAQETYYLALGDSLARGMQPNAAGTVVETTQGYVDDLYGVLRLRNPPLRLEKLGCSGETTTTMLGGGVCPYSSDPLLNNQVAAAMEFLTTHKVALVTLSIGGDNILHCFSLLGIDGPCVQNGLDSVTNELPQIIALLRSAAGPHVPIVAMNYYDPFLAAWQLGPQGQALAEASLGITLTLNAVLQTWYDAFKVPVADVARAYRIEDWRMVPVFNLPVNVLLELSWTWIGATPPDIHPNATGYAVIAGAYLQAIRAH
jgi:lysophospholipase L1-like esterase